MINFAATLCRSAVREGGAGQYSPGASSALTKIVLYSSSVYTVFHSVIYNSVGKLKFSKPHTFHFYPLFKAWVDLNFFVIFKNLTSGPRMRACWRSWRSRWSGTWRFVTRCTCCRWAIRAVWRGWAAPAGWRPCSSHYPTSSSPRQSLHQRQKK